MNKVKYEEPKMEIVISQTADIITTSTESFDGEWVPIGRSIPDADDIPTF